MDDREIIEHIHALVDEEHTLESSRHERPLGQDDHARLTDLQVQLDQLWDLLRQRRARRQVGQDPDGAAVRDPGTVEGYRQ